MVETRCLPHMDVFIIFYLSMEITPVILSTAKDLCARRARSFAALRMTARTPLTFSHEKSYLQMSGGGDMHHRLFPVALHIVLSFFFGYAYTGGGCYAGCQMAGNCVDGVSLR